VIVLEADSKIGGSTALSGGVVYAAGTAVQRERGISDSPDAMYEYYVTLNQWCVEPALVRRLCDEGAPAIEWLMGLGVEFPAQLLYASGEDGVPRGHIAQGGGAGIIRALEQAAGARAIEVAPRARVEHLHTDSGGVTGLSAAGVEIRTGAVIVASGGFGHNTKLLRRHFPDASRHGDWTWSVSAPCCRGDGLLLGESLGAALAGHNRGLLLPTPDFSHHLELKPPGWVVLVNREGRRFVDETAAYVVLSCVIGEQSGGACFAIFDEQARAQAEPDPLFADAFAAGALPLDWVSSELQRQVERGKILSADSPAELGRRAGIEPLALETMLESYNAGCRDGRDACFFKPAEALRPVERAPFYAAEIRPAIVCLTSTGLRIDAGARVLDTAERPILGLYAAGETTGGVLGAR
jgi:fumarate reductase flavoprotein subunit